MRNIFVVGGWLFVLFLAAGRVVAEVAIFTVRPSATDPAIAQFDQSHRVFLDRSVPSRGELLVYLPGTAAPTNAQDAWGRTAAEAGYHVVFLMYANGVPAAVCANDEDETTFEKFRREIIEGRDLDARVEVDRANSIEHRLVQLVRWLARERADEGWGQFLSDDDLAWTRVALAGHSQGGAHAQLMAKDRLVARVIQLGSPKDYNHRHGRAAAWYGEGATPARRMFVLVHEQDTQACSYAQQLENLRASGLDEPVSIDRATPPYGGARLLTTNFPDGKVNSATAHLGLAFDFTLPRANGRIVYAPAWRHLLTAPVD